MSPESKAEETGAGKLVVLLPGDGIGPEVVAAAVRVLDAALEGDDLRVRYEQLLAGGAAIDAYGTPLRTEDLDRCREADAILLGAVGGPAWDDMPVESRPERALLRLRSELGLGINLRPVRWTSASAGRSPLRTEVAEGADIAFIRELTGGVYFGKPSFNTRTVRGRHSVDTAEYSEKQVVDVLDFAFELARSREGRVTSVDKANVMNTSRMWREVTIEYAAAHPDVEVEHALVDSFAMALIQDPRRYDVVVTENLFGDILTDLASVIAGSLGVLPSASLRPAATAPRFGLYEPVHGSAPQIAGQNVANPIACMLSVALMLEWSLERPKAAALVRDAVQSAMDAGPLTADLHDGEGEALGTDAFADAVVGHIREKGGAREHRAVRHHVA